MILMYKDWEFKYDSNLMTAISDNDKLVFLTKSYDDIHLVIENEANKLIFQPRWSVKITEIEHKKYLIETNAYD